MLLNVLDFATVGEALAAANDGDSMYFPALAPYVAPPLGWKISKSIEIFGDGPGNSAGGHGTILMPATQAQGGQQPTGDVFVLDPTLPTSKPSYYELENVTIRDLTIQGQGNPRYGIFFEPGATEFKKVSSLRLERLIITGMGKAGISLRGRNLQGQDVVSAYFSCVEVLGSGGVGVELTSAFQVYMDRCVFSNNGKTGNYPAWRNSAAAASQLSAFQSQVAMYACEIDATGAQSSPTPPPPMVFRDCTLARIDGCRFLGFTPAGVGVRFMGSRTTVCIGACSFSVSAYGSLVVGIEVTSPPDVPSGFPGVTLILPNRFEGMGKAIVVASGARACTVFPQAYNLIAGAQVPTISLPSGAADGPFALPSLADSAGNSVYGLLLPAYPADPPTSLPSGSMYFRDGLRVLIDGQWKLAQTAP